MEDKELEEIISKAVTADLKEQFIKGMIVGWKSCAKSLYKKSLPLTSAKAIKEMLKMAFNSINLEENSD